MLAFHDGAIHVVGGSKTGNCAVPPARPMLPKAATMRTGLIERGTVVFGIQIRFFQLTL